MTTPFDAAGRVDADAFRADLRYLIETAKVHGLAVCDSTGAKDTH